MNTKTVDDIFNGKMPLKVRLLDLLVNFKKKYLLWKKGPFVGLQNIENIKEYNISDSSFDPSIKRYGLSAFGRLKNGAEFLEKTIESHIPFCDEIILVDNNSTDATREICQKMQQKYLEKIRIFQYIPEVYALGSQEYETVSENSVHCMSYYYNRVLSKTTFSHCIKLDDDHLIIPERFEHIKKEAMQSNNTFFHTPLLNIINHSDMYVVSPQSPFSGLYGDFGIFPLSKKTYFVKDKKMENFLHPYNNITTETCFFHLKFLKKDKGSGNYVGDFRKSVVNQVKNQQFITLSQPIKNLFLSLC